MMHENTFQLVSIGMPVYNGACFIGKALDSILEQSYPHFELIISDNASTDRTADICLEYAARDSRIRYVRQVTNLGAFANFHYVLLASSHERFIWAAADDWWDSDRLERLVDALLPHDAVVLGAIKKYLNNTSVAEFVPKAFKERQWWRFLLREEARCEKTYYVYGLMWKCNAVKAFLADFGCYLGDVTFCYRLVWMGDLKSISGATLHVLQHEESTGTAAAKNFRYSIIRLLFLAHPFDYYRRFIAATPLHRKVWVALALPFKALLAQTHLWWRAFRRIVLRRPFVHGALPEGERLVRDAKF